MTILYRYTKKSFFLLFILFLIVLPGNPIYGQCGSCDGQIFIPNHDFQDFDSNCITSNNSAFYFECVDEWNVNSGASSPDLYGPNFNFTAYQLVQNYVTNEGAALVAGVNFPDGIVNTSFVFPSAPNVIFQMSMDVAVVNYDWTDGTIHFVDFEDGALEIQFDESNSWSFPLDDSYWITDGFKTICIENIEPSGLDSESSLNINAVGPFGVYFIDNIALNCEIKNANLNIGEEKISSLVYDFELIEDDPSIYTTNVSSIQWDFGDPSSSSNSSSALNPQHTYTSPGAYTVTALIKDESGCCTTLSKQIIVTDGCGTVALTGTHQVADLVSALGLSGTNDLSSALAIVEIDGILEIDENVVFGEHLNFLLSPGSNIIVHSNMEMNKKGGYIGPCADKFDGIIANTGATLSIENVRIWGAEAAIKLQENSVLHATNSVIQHSRFGIYVNGQGQILTFEGNRVENCNLGLYADHTMILNIASPSTNYFNDCYHGISYSGTGGTIEHCHFNNCEFGIVLGQSPIESTINYNTIYASEVGISMSEHFRNVRIEANNIGKGGKTPRIGISIGNSGVVINDNVAIHATWRAVSAHNPMHFTFWHNSDIYVLDNNTGDTDYSSGVYVSNPNGGGIIQQNTFDGNMNNNITCISCTKTIIGANILSGATGHGIAVEGGSGGRIGTTQILNQPWKGIGLYSHNGGLIQENTIRAQWNGLLINNLSKTQDIHCNDFVKGTRDIETKAPLGPQVHRKNVFRIHGSRAFTNGLTPIEVDNSRFIVEECPTTELVDKCFHPEQWQAANFFQVMAENPDLPFPCLYISGGIPPASPGPEDTYWCWLFSHIETTQNTDPIKAWIQRYKSLKLNAFKSEITIPENCIPDNVLYCEMQELIDIEHGVEEMIENVHSLDGGFEMFKAGIETKIAELDVLDCSNDLPKLYRDIYKIVLKDMIRNDLSSSELELLVEAAELCAYTYGDVVYWARGVLDHRGEARIYDDENCVDKGGFSPRNISELLDDKIVISPNPTRDYITIENKTKFKVLNVQLTDSFGRVYEMPNQLEQSMRFDCTTLEAGVYFMTVTHASGYLTVERIVVTN